MDTKLILVEGIPGSGKTTFAKKIAEYYTRRGETAKLYLEGDSHPADLAWQACIPAGKLEAVLAPYEALREEILRHTHFSEGYAVIAYTRVKTDNFVFYQDMANYEVCDNRTSMDVYKSLHQKRWAAFGREACGKNERTVFECAFLQNHLSELLFFRLFDRPRILTYFKELIRTVEKLHPVLVYLSQPDVRETITRVAKQRVSEHGNWIDAFIQYFETSPYGKAHRIEGLDGAVRCLEERKSIEQEVMWALPVRSILLENPGYDWEAVWRKLEVQLPV